MSVRNTTLHFAIKKTAPVAVSYFFVSIAFGILMGQNGWSWVWAWAASAFIYTGAFQFVLASFLSTGTSILTAVLTALFMNSRQVFYGLSHLDDFKKCGRAYPWMIANLTDETFSLLASIDAYPSDVDQYKAEILIQMIAKISWIAGSVAGALFGEAIPLTLNGIDFALTALFITIVMDQWAKVENRKPAMTGFLCGIISLIVFGASRFILPALIFTSAVLIMRNSYSSKEADHGI